MAALLATGRHGAADLMQESLRQHYPEYSVPAFERLWLSRSALPRADRAARKFPEFRGGTGRYDTPPRDQMLPNNGKIWAR